MSDPVIDSNPDPITALRLVITNAPDQATAVALGRSLVSARLAACANVLSACTSIFEWKGQREEGGEVPLWLKTTVDRMPELVARLEAEHPYEVPEILCVEVEASAGYARWVDQQTRPEI